MPPSRPPKRIHVVRPPEGSANDSPISRDSRTIEIIRTLAQVSDKLKRSEAERYELLNELREYRKTLSDLEDKSQQTEKVYLSLQHQIQSKDGQTGEVSQRQVRFEKLLKETEDKLVRAAAGQALMEDRLKQTEDRQTAFEERMDESISHQTRLDRQLEKVVQDRELIQRKMERLEEIVIETQDTLRARALVLLTDQSAAAQGALPHVPAWKDRGDDIAHTDGGGPLTRIPQSLQTVGMGALVLAALVGGWMMSQAQKPDFPQIAVLEDGGLARLNAKDQKWEVIPAQQDGLSSDETETVVPVEQDTTTVNDTIDTVPQPEPVTDEASVPEQESDADIEDDIESEIESEAQVPPEQTPAAEAVLQADDNALLAALEEDENAVASALNEIAPAVSEALELDEQTSSATALKNDPALNISAPMKNFEQIAFVQPADIKKSVLAEQSTGPLSTRLKPDEALPPAIKTIERKAYQGVAEAQHDLAAIYTAGHGGVAQNFDRAAFWFREASENGIGNARYNLGVLYHQGLGVKRDLAKALYWYREAAKLNHPEAQYNLGIAYIEGIGTTYNPQLAAAFFERAANGGIVEAAYNLGLIFENGLLGEKSPNEALLWYKIAADQGNPDAKSAMTALSKQLQIGPEDVDKLVARMQAVYEAQRGQPAGPSQDGSNIQSQKTLLSRIQEELMQRGFYPGPADGILGPQTQDAIRSYQSKNKMKVTGQPSSTLLGHLLQNTSS